MPSKILTVNPLLEAVEDKAIQTGTGQVLDESNRGLNTASMAADRAPANQGVVKIPTPAKVLGKAPSRIASRQNEVRDQAFHSLKQKTARSHSVH